MALDNKKTLAPEFNNQATHVVTLKFAESGWIYKNSYIADPVYVAGWIKNLGVNRSYRSLDTVLDGDRNAPNVRKRSIIEPPRDSQMRGPGGEKEVYHTYSTILAQPIGTQVLWSKDTGVKTHEKTFTRLGVDSGTAPYGWEASWYENNGNLEEVKRHDQWNQMRLHVVYNDKGKPKGMKTFSTYGKLRLDIKSQKLIDGMMVWNTYLRPWMPWSETSSYPKQDRQKPVAQFSNGAEKYSKNELREATEQINARFQDITFESHSEFIPGF